MGIEVLVGVSGVGWSQGDTYSAHSVVDADGLGSEKAVGNPLSMKVVHSLCVCVCVCVCERS